MARRSHHINVKQVAFPFGQEYFPDNTQPAVEEGRGSAEGTIRPLDLSNVLPTEYGFSSFFAREPLGNFVPITTEYCFIYRAPNGNNTLVALGIFGAMFSTDGSTWVTTEVVSSDVLDAYTNGAFIIPSLAATANPNTSMVDANAAVSGCVGQINAVVTKNTAAIKALTFNSVNNNTLIDSALQNGFTLRQYPLDASNNYFAHVDSNVSPFVVASSIATVNTNFSTVVVGDLYELSVQGIHGTYTAQAGDTPTAVLTALVSAFNTSAGTAANAVLGANGVITITEGTGYAFSPLNKGHFQNISNSNIATRVNYPTPAFSIDQTQVDTSFNVASTFAGEDWIVVSGNVPTNTYSGSRLAELLVDGVAVPLVRFGTDITDINYQFDGLRLWNLSHSWTYLIRAGSTIEVRHVDPLGAGNLGTFTLEFYKVGNAATIQPDTPYTSTVAGGNAYYTPAITNTLADPNIAGYHAFVQPTGATEWYDLGAVVGNTLPTTTLDTLPAALVTSQLATVGSGNMTLLDVITSQQQLALCIDPTTYSISTYDSAINTAANYPFPIEASISLQGISPDGTEEITVNTVYNTNSIQYSLVVTTAKTWLDTRAIVNPWSYAIVQNTVYMYRKGLGKFLSLDITGSLWVNIAPTFVNLAQLSGIFAARSRLGAWDDTDSVYTSSVKNVADFTPSIATQANVSKIDAIIGRIVNIVPITNGYVIYSTGSIVLAQYNPRSKTNVFDYTALSSNQGIVSRHSVVSGGEGVHFAFTGVGLQAVSLKGLVPISVEASSYLKSSNIEPRLDWVQERYLSISANPTVSNSLLQYEFVANTGSILGGFIANDVQLANTAASVTPAFVNSLTGNVQFTLTYYTQPTDLKFNIGYPNYTDAEFIASGTSILAAGSSSLFPTPNTVTITIKATDIIKAMVFQISLYQSAWWNYWLLIKSLIHAISTPMMADTANWSTTLTDSWDSQLNFTNNTLTSSNLVYWDYASGVVNSYLRRSVSSSRGISSIPPGTTYAKFIDSNFSNDTLNATGLIAAGTNLVLGADNFNFNTLNAIATNPANGLQSVSGIPVLPAAYLSTQGSTEPVTPVFNRSLILDTELKNWGSCDGSFRNIIDYSPVNERSYNPITGQTGTKFTYDNLASTFVVEGTDGGLNLATERVTAADNSFVTYGKLGFTRTGVTRHLDTEIDLATNTTAEATVIDATGATVSSGTQSGIGRLLIQKVATAKWFVIKVFNRFNLKGIKFSGEIGGKR